MFSGFYTKFTAADAAQLLLWFITCLLCNKSRCIT